MTRPRRSATELSAVAVLPAFLLSGCGGGTTEVPERAVVEASGIVGGTAHDALLLAPADVERLAGLATVEPDVLRSVAGSLVGTDVWTEAVAGVRTIYDDAPEGVGSALVEVACQALNGRIHTDYQLHFAIFQRVNGFATSGVDRLTDTASDLFRVVHDAGGSDVPEDRAAAVLTCHTLEQLRDP